MQNMQIPRQGPSYFPMDKVGRPGEDPLFLLNRENATSSTNLINTPNNSHGSLKSPNNATGSAEDDLNKKKYTTLARILAIILCVVSVIMFIAGLINLILSASNNLLNTGCIGSTSNHYSVSLGPQGGPSMIILTWLWITVGIWAAVPPFIAGVALFVSRRSPRRMASSDYNPGLPIELQNSQNNYTNAPDIYRIFAIFSIIFCLPVAAVIGIIDIILSYYCLSSTAIKFILPIVVVIAAIVDFIIVLVAWYRVRDATDSEYQYIGSTYTIYESFEPLVTKEIPITTTVATAVTPVITGQQCCPRESSNPIVIINQPPVAQTAAAPINVLVHADHEERARPVIRHRPMPMPMPVPVPRPIPLPPPMMPIFNRPMAQQRYYPNQMYGPPAGGIMGRPNAYRGMFLPGGGNLNSPYNQFGRL